MIGSDVYVTRSPTVLLPVEIKPREFLPKILLARELTERGATVFLGAYHDLWDCVAARSTGGVFLHKGGISATDTAILCDAGTVVAMLDEEVGPALPYETVSEIYGSRLPSPASGLSQVFAYNQRHAEIIEQLRPELRGKVAAVGWPRFELLEKHAKTVHATYAKSLRETYGPFLLFSSDFGMTSEEALAAHLRVARNGRHAEELTDRYREFLAIVDLLKLAASDPGTPRIVVRPHPADDHQGWTRALRGQDGIVVEYAGDIDAWILASEGLLHRGCTSAIQAGALGVPSAYLSVADLGVRDAPTTEGQAVLSSPGELEQWTETVQREELVQEAQVVHHLGAASRIASRLIELSPDEFTWKAMPTTRRLARRTRKVAYHARKKMVGSSGVVAPARQKMPGGIRARELQRNYGILGGSEPSSWTRIAKNVLVHSKG